MKPILVPALHLSLGKPIGRWVAELPVRMMPIGSVVFGWRGPRIAVISSAFTLLLIAGCGGGGGGGDFTANPPTNPPPPAGGSGPPNAAPTISGTPGTAVVAGQTYTFRPQAVDTDGNSLTFSIRNRPSWATFDAPTGRLSGIPTSNDVGTFANIIIEVSDGRATASLTAFTITVNALGRGSAVLNWVPPTQRVDGTTLMNLAAYRIYYGASPDALNDVIRVDNIGLTTYVVENLGAGTWYFAVSAVDAAGIESLLSNGVMKTIS